MLTYMRRMFLYVLGISSLCMKSILSCSIHVCLTWEAKKEQITFKCKVSQLKHPVQFINPLKQEQGYCGMPLPVPGCHSLHNNIMQDPNTNITVLMIHRHIDITLNGPWKCRHGTNLDEAIVNVTVIQEEIVKMIIKKDNCVAEHMTWTFIGVMIGIVIVLILSTVVKTCTWNIVRRCTRDFLCGKCCIIQPKYYYATRLFIGILLSVFVVIIPYISGTPESGCKDKELFMIFGVCIVCTFVLCLSIPRKREENEQQSEDEETFRIELLDEESEQPSKDKEPSGQELLDEESEQPSEDKEPSGQELLDVEVHLPTYFEAEIKQNNI